MTQAARATVAYDPTTLPGQRVELARDRKMPLDCGVEFGPFHLAYETYGTLNAERSNAILVCHALTGDQYAATAHPLTGKPGWWQAMIGPGKPLDPNRFFIICANVIGGCMGSTGPRDINPETGHPYGLDFPVITIGDMVRAQRLLIDYLGIDQLFCVIGGSMGAMQVLQWAVSYPERVFSAMPIAGSWRHSAQNIAFHEVGRQAIMADPNWQGGAYMDTGQLPTRGLAVARMAAHITYLSEAALHRKFGRSLQDRPDISYGFEADFQVESYLRYQGSTFVDRFDANSYLYITRAMDYFDLAAEHNGQLAPAFAQSPVRFALISFTSDWLFPTSESRTVVHALNRAGAEVSFIEIDTDKGHDSFLLNEPGFHEAVRGFLQGCAEKRGLIPARPVAADSRIQPEQAKADRDEIRVDLRLIADLIEPGWRVLDIGCGDGELLDYLVHGKDVDARGLELSVDGVRAAVRRGVPAIQGDANTDLADYRTEAFDAVVLSKAIQAMQEPRAVLNHLVRIARYAIVSISNFGYWNRRLSLLLNGQMPVTDGTPGGWWDTPNIHDCSIRDFVDLCDDLGVEISQTLVLSGNRKFKRTRRPGRWANLLAEQAVFVLKRRN